MSKEHLDPIIRRSPHVVFRPMERGGVLLHLESGAYHELNPLARIIWEGLETPISAEGLAGRVRSQVDDAPPTLEEDVLEFVGELADRGLVIEGAEHEDHGRQGG